MKSTATANPDAPLPEEDLLMRRAKDGDPDAFAQLYDACVERIYRYVFFRVSDEATAEDIASQVFLKAWENLDKYRPGASPVLAWLFTIARNLVIDHYRTRKESVPLDKAVGLADDRPGVSEQAEARFNLEAMRNAMQFLTEEQQQVLTLKFIVGLPTGNIARMMGKREGAIRALQMRALQTMAKYLEKEMTV
ncbi:MAG: sigma-70 family RNA polymerase sigma factor [Chloroflexota bacterium]